MKTIITTTLLLLTSFTFADMAELDDSDLQQATGQEGITISAKLDFATGTRISTQNSGAKASELNDISNANNWEVIDNITGSIEAKGMKTDLLVSYGKNSDGAGVSAAQTTLPEHIVFEDLHSDGLYVGPGASVTRDSTGKSTSHNFIMGLEIDGTLNFPSQTKITTFVVK